MKVLHSIDELTSVPGPVSLAIGVFDGVHLGHQAVIGAATEHAAQHGGTAAVLTFDPHPLHVLRPEVAPRLLCSTRHQLAILDRLGVSHMVMCRFDQAFASISAEDFIARLASTCRPLGFISVGYSWRFGARGAGDIHLLMNAGQTLGFGVYGVPSVCVDGAVVSSTAIRDAVRLGEFDKAQRLLGREYTVLGTVVRGKQLGRQIGVPTANLDVEAEQLPPVGVYAVRALVDGQWQSGVANLGHRPTVSAEDSELSLEVHLLDFDADLYDRDIEVCFVRRLRDEQRFRDLDALKAQIAKDISAARAVLR
jgi:riboflavin kinase / FMN adenylyltransferase